MLKLLISFISTLLLPLLFIPQIKALTISVSIKPLHSLVSMVTDGVLEPHLIVKGNNSPHDIQLSGKTISQIQNSDIIFIASKHLEAPIYKALNNNPNNHLYEMVDFPSLTLLNFTNRNFIFTDTHEHEDHETHDHEDGVDFHIWLDPKNAIEILSEVSKILINADPQHANNYKSNTIKYINQLKELDAFLQTHFEQYQSTSYVLYHDGFAYLENRYNLKNSGILQPDNHVAGHILGNTLSNQKLLQLTQFLNSHKIHCVFLEPEFNNKLLMKVLDNHAHYAIIDPVGYDMTPGRELYFDLMLKILTSFQTCLSK